jgi:DNA adenine methylase
MELYRMVSSTIFTEDLFENARELLTLAPLPPEPCVGRAYWYFCFSWMGRNGLAGTSRALTSALAIRYTSGGGSPVIRFRSAADSIPPWHYRLLNILILQRDAFTLLPEIDDAEGTVLYIDSPYLFETRSDGASFEKGARYLHDFDEPTHTGLFAGSDTAKYGDMHDQLARELRRFRKARVVISYYDHPRLREMYKGFTFRSLAMHKNMASQNRRGVEGTVEAPEILILNGPSYAGGGE